MPEQQSTGKCVNWLLNKNIPSEKLIIGAAFYARVWENVNEENNGLYQSGKFKQGVAFKNLSTYIKDTSGFKYYWDEKAKAPFQYNQSRKLFATFDDKASIRSKSEFIRQKNLGGIMFWELSQDYTEGGLLEEISQALKN
jgi:chitinase